MEERRTAGIILAAGLSSRMGDFKPLMKIGDMTPLEMLIMSMKTAGLDDIYVVTGFNRERVTTALENAGVIIVNNPRYEEGMFTSIQAGVSAAVGHDCFLINPVDIPLVPPYVIKAALKHHRDMPEKFVTPCFEGRHGHPLLVPGMYGREIVESAGENGMKSVTGVHSEDMYYFDTDCESILLDMDTQEAYRAILDHYEKHRIPTEEQCREIYIRCETPEHVIRHCEAVTESALAMAEALNDHGFDLSLPLIKASGLLHDCLRIKPRHWDAGADLMMDYGYMEVADIVRAHMNYVQELPIDDIDEKDLICLSDKFCQEDRLVTPRERMSGALKKFTGKPELVKIVEGKIRASEEMVRFIEKTIGRNVQDMLRERLDALKASRGDARQLILIRHGETEKHAEKIFLGRTDVELSDEGRAQCEYVGYEMSHFNLNTDRVYCSDLNRAVQSAEIIASNMEGEVTVQKVPEFSEMALGAWDGRFMSEIKTSDPEGFEARGNDLLHYRIDENAENFQDVYDRAVPAFRKLVNETEGDLVIVSHSGVLRTILCYLEGRPLEDVLKMRFARGTYVVKELHRDPGQLEYK